ncbi:flavin reductase family protein [Pseudidiomarina aestuarii]|uniref:flavin reductase family protein n=1 Tax=Pseudidiomarina aestuarii TaxID=624146 RepID=UPI003A97ABF2
MTQTINRSEIDAMPSRYRAQFINSLSGFKSANLIGTADAEGATNLAMLSSVVHLGANPPLFAHVTRPTTVARHSLDNLQATGVYTYNHVSPRMLPAAHQAAAKYPRDVSEFDAVGLTAGYVEAFAAPYVAESELSIGMRLVEVLPIKHNGTLFVIGEIAWVRCPQKVIETDGYVDIAELDAVAISGLDSYHPVLSGTRYGYPEPD